MKKLSRAIFLSVIVCCLGLVAPLHAEEITLAQALEIFFKNNYDIIINRYEIDKSYGDYVAARLIPNPSFSVNFSGMGNGALTKNQNGLETYRLDQLIELGGKRGYRIRSATEMMEAVKLSHRDAIRNLLTGFYTTYYNLVLNQLNLDFATEELGRFDKVLDVAEKRHNAGFLSLIDFTKLKLARLDLENAVTAVANQHRNDLESFALLLGGTTGSAPAPARTELKEAFPVYEEPLLLDIAYANRFDLLSLERQLRAAEAGIALAKAQRIPDITVGAEYERFRSPVESGFGAGINLNIPLFYRNRGEILRRTAEYNQGKVHIEKTRKLIQVDVRQVLNNYNAGLTVFKAYSLRKGEMDELLGRTEKAFAVGGITVLDLLDTRRTYRDFITKYNQSITQSMLNEALIRVATGELK